MTWLNARDLLACSLWFLVGLSLWYSEVFGHKSINVALWVIYGASYLILIALLGWWNWDEIDEA